jgi:copper(I)-binding protein
MLMDLKGPLARDSTVPLTLVFKDAKGVESRIELKVPVSTAPVRWPVAVFQKRMHLSAVTPPEASSPAR